MSSSEGKADIAFASRSWIKVRNPKSPAYMRIRNATFCWLLVDECNEKRRMPNTPRKPTTRLQRQELMEDRDP
jgi:hypothetical protein